MKVKVDFEKGSIGLANGAKYKVENFTFEINPADVSVILNDKRFEIVDSKDVVIVQENMPEIVEKFFKRGKKK